MLPKALNRCTKCNKLPNLVTLLRYLLMGPLRKIWWQLTQYLRHLVVKIFSSEWQRMRISLRLHGFKFILFSTLASFLPKVNITNFERGIIFLKIGPIPASFCLFSFFSHHNFNTNWKNHRCCAWDSNPGPQNGRRRRNHRAMASTQGYQILRRSRCHKQI